MVNAQLLIPGGKRKLAEGATDLKPGSASRPFFGVEPAIVDEQGNELEGAVSGNLIIKGSWPGQMRTIFGDHERRCIQVIISPVMGQGAMKTVITGSPVE